MFFSFSICSSPFCFLLLYFTTLFPCLIKYYNIMFINIPPPMGLWMDYRCRLVRKFIHCFGALPPQGKIGLSYCLGLWDFIFRACFTSFHAHGSLVTFSLSYFILAVPLRECSGKHSCMSSSFPIVIPNDTCFFQTVQLQVHIVYSEPKKNRNNCALVNLYL